MTTAELNAAVIEPARSVGVEIQPELVSELVADAVNHPGSLPLMQYALSVQFDVTKGTTLDLDDYSSLGGMRAALTRRAEDLFAALTAEQQRAAMQILLRMVRVGHGRNDAVHRVAVAELTDLDLDPVALSEVLDQFGGGRLLSFDADPISKAAARVGLAPRGAAEQLGPAGGIRRTAPDGIAPLRRTALGDDRVGGSRASPRLSARRRAPGRSRELVDEQRVGVDRFGACADRAERHRAGGGARCPCRTGRDRTTPSRDAAGNASSFSWLRSSCSSQGSH